MAAPSAAEAEVDPGARALFEAMDEYPFRPTHQIELSYATGANSSISIVRYSRHDSGRRFYIVPCPTPDATGETWRRPGRSSECWGGNDAIYLQFKHFLADSKDIGVIMVTLGAVLACSRRVTTPYVRKT